MPRAIFGPYVNDQTNFNVNGLYASGRVAYANSPEGYLSWQKAIDDNPETGVVPRRHDERRGRSNHARRATLRLARLGPQRSRRQGPARFLRRQRRRDRDRWRRPHGHSGRRSHADGAASSSTARISARASTCRRSKARNSPSAGRRPPRATPSPSARSTRSIA